MNLTEIAEAAREHHHETAGRSDVGASEAYRLSKALFVAAIAAAYPGRDPEAIYSLWVDNMEDVAWQVRVYDRDPEYYSTFRV